MHKPCNHHQDMYNSCFFVSTRTHSQVPLKLPLQFKWRRGPDMPFGMNYSSSVLVYDTLYVGGQANMENDQYILAYDISAGKWATLPPYSTRWFAMTAIDNHLVLVGGVGCDVDGGDSKMLGVWSEDSKKWTHPYPDMTTPRSSCSAVVHNQHLVVAGGYRAGNRLSSVEVMNTDTKQWYAGPPTPIAWSSMKTAVVGDTCYFMGGVIDRSGDTKKVYKIYLPALVSQLKDTQTWKELPQLPVTCAGPLSIDGSLLAVGGWDDKYEAMSTIHLYQPDAGQWVKVADMPTPRHTPTCIMITGKELLIAGGYDNGRQATVYLGQIL